MFQLEHELQQWTGRFGRMEVMRGTDIEELEHHVRDSIANLMTMGLSEEEAFLIATHRVGEPISVGREFGKVNGGRVWGHRIFWMLAGFLFFQASQIIISALASFGRLLAALAGSSGTVMAYASVGITALCWLGLVIWLYRAATQNDGQIGRIFGNATGKAIGIRAVLIVVVATLVKFGSQIIVVKMAPLNDIGQAATISSWANALFAMLIPLTLLFVMLIVRLRMQDTVAAEQ